MLILYGVLDYITAIEYSAHIWDGILFIRQHSFFDSLRFIHFILFIDSIVQAHFVCPSNHGSQPPSTFSTIPVEYDDASLSRKSTD